MLFLNRFQRSTTQKPTSYSLVDVGHDTVKAAVVLMLPGNDEAQVVGFGQAETGYHDLTGGRIEAGAVTRPVNEALIQAEDSAERYIGQKIVPDDVIFALSGRAVIGQLFSVKHTRPKSLEPVAVKEIDALRTRAERLVRQGLSELTVEGGQWLPLAVTDAATRLDDRLVLGAVGLTGREISFSVFGVAGQASALRALQVLANRLDLEITNIVAAPQALAALTPQPEAILLDVGSAGTDICLIRNGALVAADWAPFGGYFFTQALVKGMGLGPELAKTVKHGYAKGRLTAAEAAEVETHLENHLQRWHHAVLDVLADLSFEEPLPRQIFLTGGSCLLPGLDRLLKSNPAPFVGAPEVALLGQGALPAIRDLTEAMDYHSMALTLSLTIGIPVA